MKQRRNETRFSQIVLKNLHIMILLVVAILGFTSMGISGSQSQNDITNEENDVFHTPWYYSVDGAVAQAVTLPQKVDVAQDACVTLTNRLPYAAGDTVLIYTAQQNVTVSIDGRQIYSDNGAPTTSLHFVRLEHGAEGKEIAIQLRSPYKHYSGLMNQVYIGNKSANVFAVVKENGFRFVVGFLVFGMGLILLVIFLLTKGKKTPNVYLGALFICSGYWVMAESLLLQFFIPYPLALTNSSIFSLSLLPVFSGLYYYDTISTKTMKQIGRCVIALVTIASFGLAIAACLDPKIPLETLPLYIGFMGIYVVLAFTSIMIENAKKKKIFSPTVCGFVAFGGCAMIEIIVYFVHMRNYNQSNFLSLGLLLFCVAMVIESVETVARVYQAAIKVDTLSILAYTDSLTGLKNRTAFLERVSKLDTRAHMVTLAIFDINDLKTVNDTLGHVVGDALIRHSSKLIRNSLRQNDDVYRIGGDEFIAILCHDTEISYEKLEHRMLSILKRENQAPLSYELSVAYGYATFTPNIDKTIFDTMERADKQMYVQKKRQKSKAEQE